MGKGKGEPEYWAAVVKPGTVLYEIGGVSEEAAQDVLHPPGPQDAGEGAVPPPPADVGQRRPQRRECRENER